MQIVIDIDENVFTRLFDNGIEDYAIVNDDLFAIAKSIRNGTPLTDVLDKIRAEIEQMSSELTTDGRRMIRRGSVFWIIEKYRKEKK